jgi:hypothetical protein
MPLAWNEIRHRAIKFANENSKAASEAGEKQTFWNEFFEVFGIARKTVASFEAPVKKLTGHDGAIDLFWPGKPRKPCSTPARSSWEQAPRLPFPAPSPETPGALASPTRPSQRRGCR